VERTAHSFKSVVGIFGAEKAVKLLQKLEDAAESLRPEVAANLLPQVLKEMEKVEKGLISFRAESFQSAVRAGGN